MEDYRVDLELILKAGQHSYQCGVCRAACFLSSSGSGFDAGSGAGFGAGFGSGAGSSLCADGLDVEAELYCLCASTHPETEEQETLQRWRDRKQCEEETQTDSV